MPIYLYQAFDQNGNRLKDKVEAPNRDIVIAMLKSRNFTILSIQEENIFNKEINFGVTKSFNSLDIALFVRQFAILLKSGISISMSLEILKEQIENKKMARA